MTIHLLSVILTGITRVVMHILESVVILEDTVLVGRVQTTHVYTGTGKNQEVHNCGGMTESVVVNTAYLTVHLLSVILTGRTRVVVVALLESVVIRQDIVLVGGVQTTHVYTGTGKNQEVHKSGGVTESVVETSPYLTVHVLSVILTGIIRVVVVAIWVSVVTLQNIVLVGRVQTTHVYTETG